MAKNPTRTPQEIAKHQKGLCMVPHCTKKHYKGAWICHKHRIENFKAENPLKYAYMVHKNNAKRRGHEHTLTLEEFIDFATVKTVYMDERGRTKSGLHIDRVDPKHGYHSWNIQALRNDDNVRKMHQDNKFNAPF